MTARQCDRCSAPTPATEAVKCWYGCEHQQCTRCAEQTAKEAADLLVDELFGQPVITIDTRGLL